MVATSARVWATSGEPGEQQRSYPVHMWGGASTDKGGCSHSWPPHSIRITETSTEVIFSPTNLLLTGLAFLAVHSAGVGSGSSTRRSGRRR
ncbi:hypothetical protein QF037_000618 [Streptomyces canus]|nr:hypothetical protein [Streptomyces canus]